MGERESTFQAGLDIIDSYTRSPEKSEGVTIFNSHLNEAEAPRALIQSNMADEPIPCRKAIRILGFMRR